MKPFPKKILNYFVEIPINLASLILAELNTLIYMHVKLCPIYVPTKGSMMEPGSMPCVHNFLSKSRKI